MDHLDANIVQDRMQSASKALHKTHVQVGKARLVRSMFSDRKKNLLAEYAARHLISGGSHSQAETLARSDPEYKKKFDELTQQAEDAEITIAKNDANMASFESARSLLSYNRESLRQLEG